MKRCFARAEPEDKPTGLRLPERVLDEVRAAAEAGNMPYRPFSG